jgi:hypothetical protein
VDSPLSSQSSEKNDLKPPQPSVVDAGYAITKGLISAFPYLGGAAAELFGLVIAPPLEKRRNEWMNAVAQKILELEQKQAGFRIEHLVGNQLFLTVVMQSTVAALRNHQKQKLDALQNAVVNTARGIDIEENLQLLFLDMIDSLTPLHLNILAYFSDPAKWLKDRGVGLGIVMGGADHGLETAFPELRDQREIYDPIVQDLFNRGLLNFDKNGLHTMMTDSGILASRTTELGRKFLLYIGPS